jgi:predicted house-cleaning noncanonical NTP pyrophosphatase (MazG superfamily)
MTAIARVYYNKLVRDRIPEKINSKGEQCEVRKITDDDEFQQELLKKIREEAASLAMARSKEAFLGEYVDLLMVIETLVEHLGITPDEITTAREENIAKKGGYAERHFLVWSDDIGYSSNETPQGISH